MITYRYCLLLADDQVILAGDEYDVIYIMKKLTDTYEANRLIDKYININQNI